jgi:hypothetical protein
MNDERDARKVDDPSGTPPDENLAYDPEMTEGDEANIPPESDADPESTGKEPPGEQVSSPR